MTGLSMKSPSVAASAVTGGAETGPVSAELLDKLERELAGAAPSRILEIVLVEVFAGRTAVVSSFGIDSAVLLHQVARVDPWVPVLFVDTGRHFPETLEYRDRLVSHLGLRDVRSVGPTPQDVARLDADFGRASWDPDGCCAFRKVAPLERALEGFGAWITGRKRFQAETRRTLRVLEVEGVHVKVNPLAGWSQSEIDAYARVHQLPAHPLAGRGYPSVGCAPCTSPVEPGEDPRAGRWRGRTKTECGIHRSAASLAALVPT